MNKLPDQAEPLTPRSSDNRCGRCGGLLAYDEDFERDKCRSCSRLAGPSSGPSSPTPDEIRQSVLSELAELFADADPAAFWGKYVSVGDLARLLLTERKTLPGMVSPQLSEAYLTAAPRHRQAELIPDHLASQASYRTAAIASQDVGQLPAGLLSLPSLPSIRQGRYNLNSGTGIIL